MKYAVISNGGKQYKVSEGDELLLDRMSTEPGKDIEFDQVLLVVENGNVGIGQPTVKGCRVVGKILSDEKGEKIDVVRYKAKSRYRKKIGYRHSYTKVVIEKISSK
ncbi:MAG: 50S ribosomal protein L21 [Candidatus Blackburnbacteria bacterium RIFCSPHIGHO2_02_FULL_39_13]|nr:MAG: 50S ribosomal protein L21 [Microgenomates group bacterium GW2011_GWA2_39_19]OGY06911.1 MAG: 50S ribosomal protein L21 [Candidatus Blackburnbacteria bacterium RIFCSPHIGHO2_01_FULL_40_17]OGY09199.1 MAG: 50S ribosomal protein L21 [Candidatus Blackburnbacteria bacterium RIFCSPHIGHO2_02_FULL_39_13]HBL52215.1 50S ribosomal protein L21 [Candidatus Blackburnbacteria bacterium]